MRNLTWKHGANKICSTHGCAHLVASLVLLSIILPLWG